ncbi:MAG: antibiotic biosynthesis monooxygenase [Myxococcota bacterium]|nr:antibiotic biosynthesis monooxygenase [Myxococcota bacterium]
MSVYALIELNIVPEKFEEAGEIFKGALKATREWKGCNGIEVFSNKAESKYFFIEHFETEEGWREYFERRGQASGHILEAILTEPLKVTFTQRHDFGYGPI